MLFGGECWDKATGKIHVYGDIYTYETVKQKWTHVKSPGPQPRSACSAAVHKGHLYMFGGEFTSPNQQKFKHFRCDHLRLSSRLSTLVCACETSTRCTCVACMLPKSMYLQGFMASGPEYMAVGGAQHQRWTNSSIRASHAVSSGYHLSLWWIL